MSKTPRVEGPAFTIEEGELTRQPSGSRTALRFAAPATRHFDGGLDVSVNAILTDAKDRFIGRRSCDRGRTVLANRASWFCEVDNDWLATATVVTFDIEHRFDYRRRIAAGELPALPAEADTSDYFRWLENLDPRTLEDRAVRFDFALWARSSSIDLTYVQHPKFHTDSCRTEFELDLLDADHVVCLSRNFSTSLNYAHPNYDDTGISVDRKTMRSLRFFELRGRTEGRAIARLRIEPIPA